MSNKSLWGVSISGAKNLTKALTVLQEADAPFMRKALNEAGTITTGAVKARAVGSMVEKTHFDGVKGTARTIRAELSTVHPGAKSMEFGRHYWKVNGQRVYHVPGQIARPFYGIVSGGGAIGAVSDKVRDLLMKAIEDEWSRIGDEPEAEE